MSAFTSLLDIIYPPRCSICGEFLSKNRFVEDPFCQGCANGFTPLVSPICPICSTPFSSGVETDHFCEDCLRNRPEYEEICAPYLYEGTVLEAIHRFKYGAKVRLGKILGRHLERFAETRIRKTENLLTVPVPLHGKRLRERGFNQSLLLARHVARRLKTGLDYLSVRRLRYTLPQTGLGKKGRRKNVRAAFRVVTPDAVKGKTVLLVDDVATTGNTLNECAGALKRAGCEKVICLVLAKAGRF